MSEGSMLHGQQKQAGIPALLAKARFGVVVRPPYYRWNGERFESDRLVGVDSSSIASLSGSIEVVVEGNFVGVVADSLALATDAAKQLKVEWQAVHQTPEKAPESDQAPSDSPLVRPGQSYTHSKHAYGWPSRMRWGNHPSWVIVDCRDQQLSVWGQTVTPAALKQDLSRLTALDISQIELYSADGKHASNQASGWVAIAVTMLPWMRR